MTHRPSYQELARRAQELEKEALDRKRADAVLQRSEAQYGMVSNELQDIIDFLPDATFAIDREKKVISWNRAMEEMTGVKKENMLGKGDYEYAVPFYGDRRPMLIDIVRDERPDIEQKYDYVKRVGETVYGEVFVPGVHRGKGAYLWSTAAPLLGKDGRVIGLIQSIRDISDRKQAEEAVRRSEERYRAIVEDQTELISRFRLDGALTFVNGAYCRYFDESPEKLIGNRFWHHVPEQDRQKLKDHIASFSPESPVQTIEHQVITGTGEIRWQQWEDRLILGEGGEPIEIQAVGRDITERKRAEERLKESEGRFRELAENIREVFWVETPQELLYISPAYEEIWGRSCASLYERRDSFLDSVHPEDRERVRHAYAVDRQGTAPFDQEYRIICPEGRIRWIRARSFPISEQGNIVRTVGIAEDITARKGAEDFLRIERDLALGLGSTGSLAEAMELLLDASLKLDAVDSGGIYLVEGDTGALKLICHRGLSDSFVEQVCLHASDSPHAHFVMRGEPGYWSKPAGILEMGDLLGKEGLLSLAAIPVRSGGEVVAVLNVASHARFEIPDNIRNALEAIAALIGGVVSRVRLGEKLKAQGQRLEEVNAALKVLLKQREQDRVELEESLLDNVKHLVLPYLEKLKRSRLSEEQRLYVEILEFHLEEITSPFVRKVSSRFLGLTPTEIRVSDLIRQGKTSKEVAELLGTSERAILFHRQSIRGKLGLKRRKLNLQSYLATMA